MTKPPFAFLALLAAWCAGCDAKSPLNPSPVASAPAPNFTIRQTSAQPGDGETLAYGQSGRVAIAYTLGRRVHQPRPQPDYPIGLPGRIPDPPQYQVVSCLSTDGLQCIVSASGASVGNPGGEVWNTLALSESFRGQVDQTTFVIHELIATRAGLNTSVMAREVKSLQWHFN